MNNEFKTEMVNVMRIVLGILLVFFTGYFITIEFGLSLVSFILGVLILSISVVFEDEEVEEQ